jgi:hypothetical protein
MARGVGRASRREELALIEETLAAAPHQRQEARARLEAGETQSDIALSYNVDATTIGRLAR